jgi:CRP/FNR family cyclic AMP-dependent transcriptional regulator
MAFQKVSVVGPQASQFAPVKNQLAQPTNEVSDFKGYFKVETYPHNAVIYRPTDNAEKMFLLKSGRVRILRSGKGTARSVLALLKAGDMFGDVLRTEGAQMNEMAVAQGEAEVWSIEGRDLQALIEARPQIAMEVLTGLNDRLRSYRQRVQGLTFKDVPARLADTLLALSESHGERCPHGGEFDLRQITQQDLADLVGASRSFVSTLINEMKRDGALGNVGRILCIRDQKALRRIGTKQK